MFNSIPDLPATILLYGLIAVATILAFVVLVVAVRYILANHKRLQARFCEVFIRHPLKLIPIAIYALAGGISIWLYLPRLLALYPFDTTTPLYSTIAKILYVVAIAVLTVGAFLLVIAFGRPWCARSVQQELSNIGLKNAAGETPILLSKYKDKTKLHGIVYEFLGRGSSPKEFIDNVGKISDILGLAVSSIEDGGKGRTHILVHAKPKKYDIPFELSVADGRKILKGFINLLLVGATGTGKSYALTVITYLLVRSFSARVTICDYKKSSFAQFEDTPNFYGYEDVPDGIRTFYKEFSERLEANDEERNKKIRVLVIDEYGALISAQDKKTADELKTMVANMLFMGRSLGIRVLIGVQRADAEYFKSGARDQFKAILSLGNLSREQRMMLFSDSKDSMTAKNGVGAGYLHIDGQDIERVKILPVSMADEAMMNDNIRKAML